MWVQVGVDFRVVRSLTGISLPGPGIRRSAKEKSKRIYRLCPALLLLSRSEMST